MEVNTCINAKEVGMYYTVKVIEVDGKKLKVEEGMGCDGCYLLGRPRCGEFSVKSFRQDNTSIIFVKVKDKKPKKDKSVAISTSNGCTTEAEGQNNCIYVSGYSSDVNQLCNIYDNGNGYHVTTYSYSSTVPEHRFNLGYDELEYIYLAYKALKKVERNKE